MAIEGVSGVRGADGADESVAAAMDAVRASVGRVIVGKGARGRGAPR